MFWQLPQRSSTKTGLFHDRRQRSTHEDCPSHYAAKAGLEHSITVKRVISG